MLNVKWLRVNYFSRFFLAVLIDAVMSFCISSQSASNEAAELAAIYPLSQSSRIQ